MFSPPSEGPSKTPLAALQNIYLFLLPFPDIVKLEWRIHGRTSEEGSYSHLGGRVTLGGRIWDGGPGKRRFWRVELRWDLEGVGG